MNMLKKGPDLKLSNLKVPGFLQYIYYDLKDRHLLPLVVLLLVAVVAVPILIGKNSEIEEAIPPAPIPPAGSNSKLVVAKAAPGLREYDRRFDGEVAHDPFQQQYTGGGKGEGPGSSGEPPTEATIESSGGEGGSESVPSGGSEIPESGGAPEEEPDRGQLTYFSWVIDISVTPGSGAGEGKSETTVRRSQPQYTSLPSRKVPALTYIGVTKDESRVLMLVSDKVTALYGDAVCVQGSEKCQLLAMEPGFPVTVVYGADSRTYRIELRKIRLVTTDKLNKAPLGKNGKGKKGGSKKSGRAKGYSSSEPQPITPPSTDVRLDQLIAGQ
jgi:hypothetical protein